MEFGRRCGSSANFLSKPEVPGKTEGPGSGGSGEGRKVRGPECPGWTGSSGGRDSAKNRDLGIVDLGGKTWGKAQIRRGKRRNWRKRRVGRLDLRATHKIHGSKPTKSQHTNKSQKKIGAIFGGDFRIRTKNNKIRLETQRGGSEIVINVALDTKMM